MPSIRCTSAGSCSIGTTSSLSTEIWSLRELRFLSLLDSKPLILELTLASCSARAATVDASLSSLASTSSLLLLFNGGIGDVNNDNPGLEEEHEANPDDEELFSLISFSGSNSLREPVESHLSLCISRNSMPWSILQVSQTNLRERKRERGSEGDIRLD